MHIDLFLVIYKEVEMKYGWDFVIVSGNYNNLKK